MRAPRCRFGLRVRFVNTNTFVKTACRFIPDTREQAERYGRKGIERGDIDAFEVIDKRSKS